MLGLSAVHFREVFRALVAKVGLPPEDWQPYSLRRGGATADFRHHGRMDLTMIRGRWANQRTARIYVNDALAALAELKAGAARETRIQWYAARAWR